MPAAISSREAATVAIAEVFRRYGYAGASLSMISEGAGLGKGSLYHWFPGGKAEMAEAVLAHIDAWFEAEIFAPLRSGADPRGAIDRMLDSCLVYFQSGRRVCLVGAFALDEARDRFADAIKGYFSAWIAALAEALVHAGKPPKAAQGMAEAAVAEIQGGLILARALNTPDAFLKALERLRNQLCGLSRP